MRFNCGIKIFPPYGVYINTFVVVGAGKFRGGSEAKKSLKISLKLKEYVLTKVAKKSSTKPLYVVKVLSPILLIYLRIDTPFNKT